MGSFEPFDINGPGVPDTLFGIPNEIENSKIVILPVPWEVTVSYSTGTARAPEAIVKASTQIDLFHKEIQRVYSLGVSLYPVNDNLYQENITLRYLAEKHLKTITNNSETDSAKIITKRINEASETLNIYIKNTSSKLIKEGKIVGILGGDHSCCLGLIRSLADRYVDFGILQIDAHADLRKSYEGFLYSHGSIMFNALKLPSVKKLVQVGIRDYCEEEHQLIEHSNGRIRTFFDSDITSDIYQGKNWSKVCDEIINELPDKVYVSFDIDGLDPKLCPNTGTPVPGGFDLQQISYLLKRIVNSGRKIIGFDLCEVSPGHNEWDANVGARALWELCNWTGVSQGYLSLN